MQPIQLVNIEDAARRIVKRYRGGQTFRAPSIRELIDPPPTLAGIHWALRFRLVDIVKYNGDGEYERRS